MNLQASPTTTSPTATTSATATTAPAIATNLTHRPAFNFPQGQCWINGTLVAPDEARISVFDHGLLYGDGVFEGMRFYHQQLFRPSSHLQRLRRSLKALDLDLPYSDEQLMAGLQLTVNASGLTEGYVRLLVTRGTGSLGLDPRSCPQCSVIILATELTLIESTHRAQGIDLMTASTKRVTGSGLDCRVKSLNYLHSVLARIEANHAGADEAILLNQWGHVAECSAENIFIVMNCPSTKDQTDTPRYRLLTPPVTDGALEGVTRGVILSLAKELGIACLSQSLTPYDLYAASECFLTGTGAKLMPVKRIDGRKIASSPGVIFKRLESAFQRLIAAECAIAPP